MKKGVNDRIKVLSMLDIYTSDNANIKIDGSIEHPTMESANIKLHPATANIVYIHINRNIIIGIYFKHSIAILWFFINVFILL